MALRAHSFAKPTPEIEYSAAKRDIGFCHASSYSFSRVSSIQSGMSFLL
jgi:hypothetical protein